MAHEVVETLNVRALDKGLKLELVFPEALPATIVGDPARLRQILTNLIGNAIKFTEQGSVTVTLRLAARQRCRDGTRATAWMCSDTGIGIPADKLESVFEPFVQAEASTTRRFGGTGLGLTISRGFARAMGGDIVASSVYGSGTTFHVQLDAGSLEGASMLSRHELALHATRVDVAVEAVAGSSRRARILIVDDGAENRQLLRIVLEEVGLQVAEAENGLLAVERIAAERFDFVYMDMQMPVLDGVGATRRLREAGCTLPIVALTANAMKGFERELDEAGFSGFMTKPIDIESLLADLAARIGGRRVTTDAPQPGAVAAGQALPVAPAGGPAPGQATPELAPIVSRLSEPSAPARHRRTIRRAAAGQDGGDRRGAGRAPHGGPGRARALAQGRRRQCRLRRPVPDRRRRSRRPPRPATMRRPRRCGPSCWRWRTGSAPDSVSNRRPRCRPPGVRRHGTGPAVVAQPLQLRP